MATDSQGRPLDITDGRVARRVPSIIPPRKIWSPLKGIKVDGFQTKSSQELYLACPAHHVLFHGSRGPGKTDVQLMQFRSMVGKGYGQYWKGIVFDRRYKNLQDMISKAKRWFLQFNDGCRFLKSQGDLKFTWPTGEELVFRVFDSEDAYWDYHGHEYPMIMWNELTKFPTPSFYDLMMSCNRTSFIPIRHAQKLTDEDHHLLDRVEYDIQRFELEHGVVARERLESKLPPKIPLWVRSTTNPYGPGHAWVKKRFIDAAGPGVVHRIKTEVFNPQTQKKEWVEKTQVHIFGSYKENIYLDPDYIADLENIREENRRQAWLYGNWNITAGGAFDDLWTVQVHVLARFRVPKAWTVFRAFDWGSTHPFSVGWWARCDGTDCVLADGTKWCPPKNTLIRVAEWYGCERDRLGEMKLGENKGVMMSSPDIAKGIAYREALMIGAGWIHEVEAGPADNQINDVREKDVPTIASKMSAEGVDFIDSDKSSGSRKIGLQLMRDRLQASILKEGPGVYVMDNCPALLALLPSLPRDEDDMDDIDTTAEDHIWDETRYVVLMTDFRAAKSLKLELPR